MHTSRIRGRVNIRRATMRRGGWRFIQIITAVALVIQTTSLSTFGVPSADAAVANPSLQQTCGLDIGLVIDRSGSMNATEMGQIKTAMGNFATAFDGTPTAFSLTSFATSATIEQGFSMTPAQAATAVQNFSPTLAGETNWDAGLAASNSTLDPRPATNGNLIVIATDGSPNRWGYPATNPAFDWNQGLSNAVIRADAIKSTGTRIVVVAIGEDPTDPDYSFIDPTWNNPKLTAISGPTIATTPAQITVNTDVIKVTDFNGVGSALADYAKALCPGSIRVNKLVDTNFDNVYEGDNPAANQLGFRWTLNGGAPMTMGHTESATPGNHSVTEVSAAGYGFVGWYPTNGNGSCSDPRTLNGTTLPITVNVAPQQNTEITLCNRLVPGTLTVNKNFDDDGNGTVDRTNPAGWTWDVQTGAQNNAGGASLSLAPATYSVTEDAVAGFSSLWSCSNQTTGTGTGLSVALASGQAITCTFTNTKQVTTLALDKTGPATTNPGNQITYSLAWSVGGNTSATNAVMTDPIPAHTTFVSATNGGTFASGVVTWNLGTKAPGTSGTVSVTVAVSSNLTSPTTLTNTGSFDTDQTPPTSDTVTTNVTIPQVLGAATEPKLTITKAVNPATTNPGKTITYTLIVKNTGDGDAIDVVVTDTLPNGFTYADSGRTTKSWSYAKLAPGASQTIVFKVTAGSKVKAGNYVNHATALANGLDPMAAQATVKIVVPQVKGLAATGIGLRDYAIFLTGLACLGAGFILMRRYRREFGF